MWISRRNGDDCFEVQAARRRPSPPYEYRVVSAHKQRRRTGCFSMSGDVTTSDFVIHRRSGFLSWELQTQSEYIFLAKSSLTRFWPFTNARDTNRTCLVKEKTDREEERLRKECTFKPNLISEGNGATVVPSKGAMQGFFNPNGSSRCVSNSSFVIRELAIPISTAKRRGQMLEASQLRSESGAFDSHPTLTKIGTSQCSTN